MAVAGSSTDDGFTAAGAARMAASPALPATEVAPDRAPYSPWSERGSVFRPERASARGGLKLDVRAGSITRPAIDISLEAVGAGAVGGGVAGAGLAGGVAPAPASLGISLVFSTAVAAVFSVSLSAAPACLRRKTSAKITSFEVASRRVPSGPAALSLDRGTGTGVTIAAGFMRFSSRFGLCRARTLRSGAARPIRRMRNGCRWSGKRIRPAASGRAGRRRPVRWKRVLRRWC